VAITAAIIGVSQLSGARARTAPQSLRLCTHDSVSLNVIADLRKWRPIHKTHYVYIDQEQEQVHG